MKRPTWIIVWNDEMSVGIPEIDADHKHFFALIHDLNRAITEHKAPEEIRGGLQVIIDDAERHFSQEERLFEEWQYPDTGKHAGSHANALEALRVIMKNFIPYGHDSSWIDAGLRIKDILLYHILNEDMKYADFYRNSRASAPAEEVLG